MKTGFFGDSIELSSWRRLGALILCAAMSVTSMGMPCVAAAIDQGAQASAGKAFPVGCVLPAMSAVPAWASPRLMSRDPQSVTGAPSLSQRAEVSATERVAALPATARH